MKKNRVKVRLESPGIWVIQLAVGYSGNSLLRRWYLNKHLEEIGRQMDISENTGLGGGNVMCVGSSTWGSPVKPSVPQLRVNGKESEKRVGEMRRGLTLDRNLLRPGRLFQILAFTLTEMGSQWRELNVRYELVLADNGAGI